MRAINVRIKLGATLSQKGLLWLALALMGTLKLIPPSVYPSLRD